MDGGITATSLGNLAGRPRAANPCVAGRLSGDVGERAGLRPRMAAHSFQTCHRQGIPKGPDRYSVRTGARGEECWADVKVESSPEIWGRVTMMPPGIEVTSAEGKA